MQQALCVYYNVPAIHIGSYVPRKDNEIRSVMNADATPHSHTFSPGELSEELVTQEKRKKGWTMNCDVGEATEGLEHGCANHATEGKCFCPPSAAVT